MVPITIVFCKYGDRFLHFLQRGQQVFRIDLSLHLSPSKEISHFPLSIRQIPLVSEMELRNPATPANLNFPKPEKISEGPKQWSIQ